MREDAEEIKKKIDLVEFIGSFISLKKSGRGYKALCPFHQEKTPSFVVSPDRQIWHCFGACQQGGDIFSFLMKWENITFFEALQDLAKKAGVKLKKSSFEDKTWKKRERLIGLNTLATEYFIYILHKTKFGNNALDYLKQRVVNEKIIKTFQIGYAPNSWDSLLNFLLKKKYDQQEIFDSGLVIRSEKGSLYDRFRGRIIFPIKDTRGNIVGFSGRTLEKNTREAKYINTPETFLYHKRESLYGIHLAKEAIKKENNVILVEGEFDVISPYQYGIEHLVGIKGSALTKEQLMFLKRYTSKITLALDSDAAGIEAMKKGIEEAENLEFEIGIINFDFAKDPDEAVRTDINKFKKIIQKPMPFYDFIFAIAQKKYPDNDSFSKKKLAEEVGIYLEKIKNPIVQSHYIKKLALLLDVSESSVEILLRTIRRKNKQKFFYQNEKKQVNETIRELLIEKYILSLLFQNENPFKAAEEIFKILNTADFTLPAHQKICTTFFELKEKQPKEIKFQANAFVKHLPPELQSVFDELYLFASSEITLKNEKIEKLLYEGKRYSLKRKLTQLLTSSDEQDDNNIKDALKKISQELSQVEKTIMTL